MYGSIRIYCISLFSFLFSQLAGGQQVYFDKSYDLLGYTDNLYTVHELEEGGYLFIYSGSLFFSPNGTHIRVVKIDEHGDTLWSKAYSKNPGYYSNANTVITSDGNIAYAVSDRDGSTTATMNFYGLWKFDLNGDTIFTKRYGRDTLNNLAQWLIETNDKGFAIVGQSSSDSVIGDIYFVKTDSAGNLEWGKNYGGSNWDAAVSVVQTSDSGYLMLGWTRSFGNGQRDFYLIKTDDSGNQEWQKTYGGGDMDSGWGITELSDGNYLLTGARIIGGVDKGYLYKIDSQGIIIWQKSYLYNSNQSELFWAKELIDKSIIAVGVTDNSSEGNAGWLIKTDSIGNELWQRKYNKSNLPDLFYNVLSTSDGGFLLSGQCFNTAINSQDAWLLKVDSIGCPYENCTVGIDEREKVVVADIWPNPVHELLNIELQDNGNKKYELNILDLQGKLVYQTTLISQLSSHTMNNLTNGIYLLNIFNSEKSTTVKIVVQH